MQTPSRRRREGGAWPLWLFAAALHTAAVERSQAAAPEALQFRITEGRVQNAFYQQGPVAAHLLLSDGAQPRVLVAFPAGNSGVGLWFKDAQQPVRWSLGEIKGATRSDARGRPLHGIVAAASVDGPLVVRDAVLSSVRVLRDYQINRDHPSEVKASATVSRGRVEWARPRLDGAAGYALAIDLENGEVQRAHDGTLTLSPSTRGDKLRLQITALTGEAPLTPFGASRLLGSEAGDDLRSRQVLSFLSYEEKYLAGSWRFDTYFGRDTLMSLRLLAPALQPDALERGLMSVVQRLAPNGEVAHEEDIGEFAVLRHRKQGLAASDAPIYDYKMIDDDFMLAPAAAHFLLEQPRGRPRAAAFLASRTPNGESVGAALVRNLEWVATSARPFAKRPASSNLISFKSGSNVGQWRDSEEGLAGGRYPYDVNAVLVPAALSAIAQFVRSGVLKPYLSPAQLEMFSTTDEAAEVWSREAPPLFRVRLNHADARRQIANYAASLNVDPSSAIDALPSKETIVNAIALDADHKPIPVVHSDGGFALLLRDPPAEDVVQLVDGMMRPFPAGLLTDAGVLVANPVFASADWRRKLGRTAYHGTVVWSWQQALLAAGLERQLRRRDLPAAALERLRDARRRLWIAIDTTRDLRASELWSWRFVDGRYEATPFGQSTGDADESNAAQLWSTVYLGIARPRD